MIHQVFCNYTLLAELGQGGVSAVYQARDNRTGKLVALKVLNKQMQGNALAKERFRREPKLQFLHPKIVPVLEADICAGQMYFTMELVNGESLEKMIRRGPLTPRQLYAYLRDIADALDAAHQRGIIHRDIKPSNILVRTADQVALLTDFGVAKSLSLPTGSLTQTDLHLIGTAEYMSPELARNSADLTRASDIYSLGVTAFYALSGRLPFAAESQLVLAHKHINEAPPKLHEVNPRIPREVSDVVMRAMNKAPVDRYPTASAFANAFTEAVMQSQGHGSQSAPKAAASTALAGRWLWWAAGGLAMLAFTVVAISVWRRPSPSTPALPTSATGVPVRTATAAPTRAQAQLASTSTQQPKPQATPRPTQQASKPAPTQAANNTPRPVATRAPTGAATATFSVAEPTATLAPTITPPRVTATPASAAPGGTATIAPPAGGKTAAFDVAYNGGGYNNWGRPTNACDAPFNDKDAVLRFEINLNVTLTAPAADGQNRVRAQFVDVGGANMVTCWIEGSGSLSQGQPVRIKLATYTPARNVGRLNLFVGNTRKSLCFNDVVATLC